MKPIPTRATRRFAAAAAAVGLLGAVGLPGNPVGLGMLLVAVGVMVAAATLGAIPPRGPHVLFAGLALLLAASAVLRDARWLVTLDLTSAAVLASLAASRARAPRAVVRGAVALVGRLPAAPIFAAWCTGIRPRPGAAGRVMPAGRGLILAAALTLVFGGLFASADAAFAHITGQVLTPDVNLGLLPARLALFVAIVAVTAGLVAVAHAGPAASKGEREASAARRAEWITALAVLDALFAAFVVVQLAVLFGGNDHVLATAGLTYAEYARAGFVQLLVAALLTLAVLAAAWPHSRRPTGRPDALELLMGMLCVLTLVVLVSALRRLGLYEDAFGFTVARLSGHAAILWIGSVVVLVMAATVLRRSGWLALAVAGLTGAALLAFTLVNPEGLVAQKNVDRFEESGKIDTDYLSGLSADATPALAALPRRLAACAITVGSDGVEADSFFSLNLSRSRARAALANMRKRPTLASC